MPVAPGLRRERFQVGSTIVRREVLHGRPWMEQPVTVVHDDHGCLGVLLQPGSPFTFFEHPFGPHPWSGLSEWAGSSVLQLQRDGDAYSAWKFFDLQGAFTHWYVNFQEPLVRHVEPDGGGHFNTADLGLDIVIPSDGSPWQWKDQGDPDVMVATGRISQSERERIRAEAATVAAQLDANTRWWSRWDDWRVTAPRPQQQYCADV